MKSIITTFSITFVFGFLLISCDKDDEIAEMPCELEIILEPVCSFNPKLAPDVNFPVRVLLNGNVISHPEYSFSWNSDPNFSGSAISVSFTDLPLEVVVTEISTGCSGQAILEKEYWD